MFRFPSFRSRLQAALLGLALAAIVLTGWEASSGAVTALEQATYDRLTAIRETKRGQIEQYFRNLASHVLALSVDESSISALESFREAWSRIPPPAGAAEQALRAFYREQLAPRLGQDLSAGELLSRWYPAEPRVRTLQHWFLAANPHPVGSKDLLLQPAAPSPYGVAHARYHPTLHRYQGAFGFYDIFLIDASGRVLYTVFKEIDLGANLSEAPYRDTPLASAFHRAIAVGGGEEMILEDYQPYVASHYRPAAFAAAPVRRAGVSIGVLAIQVSVDEINRVMTGGRNWLAEGFGQSGQAYIVGPDQRLRSDARFELEQPEAYFAQLREAGVPAEIVDRVARNRTAALTLPAGESLAAALRARRAGSGIGENFQKVPVLRSYAPLSLAGLDWFVVAEIAVQEAFAPVERLRLRIWGVGLLIAVAFVFAARWLGGSITRPVLALEETARKLGGGDFATRVPVESSDEIGRLAQSFNRMAQDLERTTVSKDELDRANQELRRQQAQLEELAGKLLTAQEEERSRVARELHDDIVQRMAALAIDSGQAKRASDPGMLQSALERIQQQLRRIADDIHSLSRRLHSSTLDDLGLLAAMEGEARGLFERGGPVVRMEAAGAFEKLSPAVALPLYRIVQEAFRNIERHAHATEVTVRIRRLPESLELRIADDGAGFDRSTPSWRPGVGLASIAERARLLGGTAAMHAEPGKGTVLEVQVPWREES